MPRSGDHPSAADGRRPPIGPSDQQLSRDYTDDLLVAAGRGDLPAFATFYDQTVATVFGLLRSVLGESVGAERATERVYLQLWRAAPRFDPTGRSAYSLLLSTARRELVVRVRDAVAQNQAAIRPHEEAPGAG
jgi:Sigma-70 region 2.